MRKEHFIKQQRFHISTADGSLSRELFDETTRLFNNQLHQVTAEVFDSLASEKLLIYIDSLEIDLGHVGFPYTTRELTDTYREALTAALSARLADIDTGNVSGHSQPAASAIEFSYRALLEQYLLYGTVASWSGDSGQAGPDWIFEKCREEDATALGLTIKQLIHDRDVRQRLVYNFREDVARQTVTFVTPSDAAYILYYHERVSDLQHTHQFVKASENSFRKALWLFILDFLSNEGGSYFNKKMFARQTLLSIAHHYNMDFGRLLFYLAEAIELLPGSIIQNQELIHTIHEISGEHIKEDLRRRMNDVYENDETGLAGERERIQGLFFFLVHGFFRHTAFVPQQSELRDLFVVAMDTSPEHVLAFVREHGKESLFRRQILVYLGEPVVRKIISVLEPADAEGIFHYVDLTIGLQKRRQVIKSTETDFRESLWNLVLLFLLADRGSTFNLRTFIESHVRTLAAHYNMEFKTLLALLVQEVVQLNMLAGNQVSLFYILMEILKERSGDQETGSVNSMSEDTIRYRVTHELTDMQADRNALLYWLEHGIWPWWYTTTGAKPEDAFRTFIYRYPAESALLLKMAIISGKISVAFFIKYETLFLEVMANFEDGHRAVLLYRNMAGTGDSLKAVINPVAMRRILVESYMRAYLKQGFTSFDSNWFFSSFYGTLKASLSPKTYRYVVSEFDKNDVVKTFEGHLFVFQQGRKQTKDLFIYDLAETTYSETNALHILDLFNDSGNMPVGLDTPDDRAFYLIAYFLKHASWPSAIISTGTHGTEVLLQQLLQFLYQRNRHKLITLFGRPDVTAMTQIRFFETILTHGVKQIPAFRKFIQEYSEKAWQALARETRLAGYTGVQLLSEVFSGIIAIKNPEERLQQWVYFLGIATFRTYVAQQMPELRFAALLEETKQAHLNEVYRELKEIFTLLVSDSFERNQLTVWLREYFLGILTGSNTGTTGSADLLRGFILFLHHSRRQDIGRWMSRLRQHLPALNGSAMAQQRTLLAVIGGAVSGYITYQNHVESIRKAYDQSEEELQQKLTDDGFSLLKEKSRILQKKEKQQEKQESKKEKMRPGEEITIQNAGLVLLQPYFPQLFSRTGLTTDNKWISGGAQARAVRLLQYVATGNEEAGEHMLVLNKILCGMEPHEFLIETTAIAEEEKAITDGMLKAVTQQWDKMKNTSVEGFRATFLMRDGFIASAEEAWILRVEPKAYDILLQTLPWSYGFIKYSWMNKPLNVTWI